MVPQTAMRMMELLIEAGLPKGVVNLVTCTRVEADSLLVEPARPGISFVGSTSVGKHIYETAARAGKRVQALTEAKNHALWCWTTPSWSVPWQASSTRPTAAPASAAWRSRSSASQESIADEFVETAAGMAAKLKIGPAYDSRDAAGPDGFGKHRRIRRVGDRAGRGGRRQAGARRSRARPSHGYENGY